MSTSNQRLSVPPVRKQIPRELTDTERSAFNAIADVLCGSDGSVPLPSRCAEFPEMLDLALATRSDAFDAILATVGQSPQDPDELDAWLRGLHDSDSESFQAVSTVAAGAYLMVPQIKAAVGYPGQRRNPPKPDEAVDEISDGILDPVMDRGYFYIPTPGQERSQ